MSQVGQRRELVKSWVITKKQKVDIFELGSSRAVTTGLEHLGLVLSSNGVYLVFSETGQFPGHRR